MKDYIVLGGGCFWGLEKLLSDLDGVTSTSVGYAGGGLKNPEYNEVKTGETGHVESVRVEFDNTLISFKDLLHFFFRVHDPTTSDRQGNDVGTQYRSVIFYNTDEQKEESQEVISEVNAGDRFEGVVVTAVEKEREYYLAEDYHQKYIDKNPSGYTCHFIRD
ncbi:MAG: peptide-methionine (S)-S-oxide reductase MsrA [Bdellovibrionales bacterium]